MSTDSVDYGVVDDSPLNEYIQRETIIPKENIHPMKLFTLLCASLLLFSSCLFRSADQPPDPVDLEQILERGNLRVITMAGPISYFVFRGQPMGYEYELMSRFGNHLGLPIEIILADSIDEMFELLESGDGDVVAYRLTVTGERRASAAFSIPLYHTRQVLVQRIPDARASVALSRAVERPVRSPAHLSGARIHVEAGTAHAERLRNLAAEIGSDIEVVEADVNLSGADLIAMVAGGTIDFAVANRDLAQLMSDAVSGLDVSLPLSLDRQVAWATRPGSPDLLDALNQWLELEQKHVDFHVIHRKYFVDHRSFRNRMTSPYLAEAAGTDPGRVRVLSPYDDILRTQAERLGWDWLMLAALVQQESRFDPWARSWMGAMGLMQLMPATARYFGVTNPFDPGQNIHGGVSFLEWLQSYWSERIEDPEQRLRFVIASYNVGQGHVEDARRLASLHEANPDVWNTGVVPYLLAKSDPQFYNHEVVHHGYARGQEPVNFVERVFTLAEHYRRFFE